VDHGWIDYQAVRDVVEDYEEGVGEKSLLRYVESSY